MLGHHYRGMCFILQLILLLFLSATVPTNGLGWENYPEFQSLTETEEASFEGASLLNSEYTSDLFSYRKPSSWEYLWLTHSKGLEMSFGSLNTIRFLMENRVKVQLPLTDLFEFRFSYFDESNLERQGLHLIGELIFWPWSMFGIVLYGEPSFRKPNDDTGIALLLRPNERHEIRLFNTFIDVTRLKYPDSPDRFIEPDLPYARGLVGRAWSLPLKGSSFGNFFEYAIRHETPTSWQFLDKNYIYHYWKWFASAYGRYQFSRNISAALRFQFDRKHESKEPLSPTTATMGSWYTSRITLFTEETFFEIGPKMDWDVTFGLGYVMRTWDTSQGSGGYNDLLPYFRWAIPAWGIPEKKDHWILGYLMTRHGENGSSAVGINQRNDGRIEQRLNISYEFSFGKQGILTIFGSADLDEFGTRNSWSGGCGQLQLFF